MSCWHRFREDIGTVTTELASAEPLHNLPNLQKRFFGRSRELTLLQDRLTDPAYRLVSIVGVGGAGKTRLGIEAGLRLVNSFPDGVWFVPLAGVDPQRSGLQDAIVNAIAQALSFNFSGTHRPLDQLVNFLRSAELLLILDNVEHLLEEIDVVTEILRRTKQLAVLCTSRVVLNLEAETVVSLGGLTNDGRVVNTKREQADPIVQLFADRAQRAGCELSIDGDSRSAYFAHRPIGRRQSAGDRIGSGASANPLAAANCCGD